MSDEQHGQRIRPGAAAVAALLVVAGAIALFVGIRAQQSPPQPVAAGSSSTASPSSASPSSASAPGIPAPTAGHGPVLPASQPVHLDVPAIGVTSDLLDLGLNPDGTVEVPPLAKDSRAGWYRESPTPGEVGPSLILGHVDSAEYGPGVFFKLGNLRPGDQISVTRADGTTAVFRVDRVASYPKDAFPTLEVYGNTDDAELRLITCGGDFDAAARSYLNNIVVYASLSGSSRS